jgi:hypothetical protein
MGLRLLHYRFVFALLGALALLAGGLFAVPWFAAAGAIAALTSEGAAIAQSRRRFPQPLPRVLRGAAEAFPAIGVAAFQPYAIGVAVIVVVYALLASGMQTVSTSRGLMLGHIRGETLRRVLTAGCSGALLLIPLSYAFEFELESLTGMREQSLALFIVALVLIVSLRGLLDIGLEIRQAGRRAAGRNVDS